ncbi:FAD-dependent oxidoreductase [Alterisphingorhabdus coralli]|uniref:FAD-dependent oxidoreductase n=1 Tax=Alterisphingorhabdus coralli TaxID=3071408 RepID=A0AA97FA75_9SPHN|nr:FAD-dependent oxidoreductase [Parasphingorhabdus sp. SCSIO 66989]WOE75897.1 FAD-dependent oxidoreductase [Parasphingorhabdus sp. SCSIO 66989]
MTSAYALARKGWQVELIDKEDGPAQGASFANGAQLSYNYTDALASASIWRDFPKLLLRQEDAFRLHLQPSLDYVHWLLKFHGESNEKQFLSNTVAVLKLAAESKAAMEALTDEHDLKFGFQAAGKIHLHYTEKGFDRAQSLVALKQQNGGVQKILTPEEAVSLEPAVEYQLSNLAGAIYSPEDAVGDARKFCTGMMALLQQEYGVKFRFGESVEALDLDNGPARLTLDSGEELPASLITICAGHGSSTLLRPNGIRLSIQPMKGYSFDIRSGNRSPKISITDSKRRIVFTNLGDRVRIAGLADLGDDTRKVDSDRIQCLIQSAKMSLPEAGDYETADNFWAGHRPMTPNSQPIISRPRQNLAINAGHGMLGWTLAMGAANRLAALV